MAKPDTVTCTTCGLLAKRGFDGELREVPEKERASGALLVPMSPLSDFTQTHGKAVCFRGAWDLAQEVDPLGNSRDVKALTRAVLQKPRHCDEWFQYHAHCSPLWHSERQLKVRDDQRREAHDLQLAQMARDGRESQVAVAQAIQKSNEAIADIVEKTDHFTTKWTKRAFGAVVVGIVIAFIGVAFTILAWLHSVNPSMP